MNFEITSGGGESRGLELEIEVCRILREKGLHVATAESCTGGLLAGKITSVAGASECFECGVVTYSNEQKVKLLGVNRATLGECGAVSPNTAVEMARGVRHLGGADRHRNYGYRGSGRRKRRKACRTCIYRGQCGECSAFLPLCV